jgi:hypothetical protein
MVPNNRRTRRTNTELYDSDLSWMPPETDDLFLMRLEQAILDRMDERIDARLGAIKPPSRGRRRRRAAVFVASVAALIVALHAIGHAAVTDGPASADEIIIRDGSIFSRNGIESRLGKPVPPVKPKPPAEAERPADPARPSP